MCFQAKLCLLMMSLPAYNICQIQTQKALKVHNGPAGENPSVLVKAGVQSY